MEIEMQTDNRQDIKKFPDELTLPPKFMILT